MREAGGSSLLVERLNTLALTLVLCRLLALACIIVIYHNSQPKISLQIDANGSHYHCPVQAHHALTHEGPSLKCPRAPVVSVGHAKSAFPLNERLQATCCTMCKGHQHISLIAPLRYRLYITSAQLAQNMKRT